MDVVQRERQIAGWIFVKLVYEGLSEAQAKETACEAFDLDTRRIEQIWQRHNPSHAGVDAMQAWARKASELAEREPRYKSGTAWRDWAREVKEHNRMLP